jgi:hypothetical protein
MVIPGPLAISMRRTSFISAGLIASRACCPVTQTKPNRPMLAVNHCARAADALGPQPTHRSKSLLVRVCVISVGDSRDSE